MASTFLAGALGVVSPADGSKPYGAPVMWVPNRTAVLLSWDKQATVRRMVENFKVDLGDVSSAVSLASLSSQPEPDPCICNAGV